MKLTASSIYKAFSDKRAIFLAAFDRYTDMRGAQLHPLLEAERTGLGKVAAMLRLYVETSQSIEGRRRCLIAGSAMELGSHDVDMAARVAAALLSCCRFGGHLNLKLTELPHVRLGEGRFPKSLQHASIPGGAGPLTAF